MPIDASKITLRELGVAVNADKLNKALGPERHPIENWRTVVESSDDEVIDQ